MTREFIIWGWPAGRSGDLERVPLYTRAESQAEAEKVMTWLAAEHGCHGMTVQVLDGRLPDFAATLR